MFRKHFIRAGYPDADPESLVSDVELSGWVAGGDVVRDWLERPPKDPSEAPPIDDEARAKLRIYVRYDPGLSDEEFFRIWDLTVDFRSWAKAELEAEKEKELEDLRQN